MYGFTKNFTLAIFSSILIGTLALSYFTVNKNQQPSFEDFNDQQFCAHDHLLQNAVESDPAIKAKVEGQEEQFYNYMTSSASLTESIVADFTLPVVVHIIHQNGQEDIPNTQVEQAIQDLNDGFANTLNTQIEFCLAKNNPEGDPSTGVTRVQSPLTNVTIETEDLMLKDLDRWDPTKYINIWVVKSIGSDALLGPVRGYSYLPAFHGTNRDGVVIEAAFMGSTPENSKVLVHELGHYLGLYHTFYGGCGNDDCLLDGDRVCDTPPDWTVALAPCEVTENSCYTDVNAADANNPFTSDQNDLRENYMDINPLECYEAFTQGQADRMIFFINGARSSLVGSTVCDTDCDTPVEDLSFMPSNDTIIPIGTQLSFVSTSVNATIFNWTLNGTSVSTAANLNQLFDEAGTFTLTLTAGNADVDCNITYSIQVTVIDCFGNTHVSDATGVDVFMCGQPGTPCKTIQYALDNVICTGDTIFIHSGTYDLPAATPVTTPIALIPEGYTVTFFGVEDNGDVIIDGGNVRRGFVYDYNSGNCPSSLMGNGLDLSHQINFAHLTIQNGQSLEETCTDGTFLARGAAIDIVNRDSSSLHLTIDDCLFFNNYTFDDEPTNIGNPSFGAIFFNGAVDDLAAANTSSSFTVTNSEFSNNRAEQDANGGTGGALTLFLVKEINISNSYFCNNSVFTSNGDAGDFDLNRNAGGAIVIYDRSNFALPNNNNHTVDNCYFFDNSATSTNGAGFFNNSEGGAIFLGRGSADQTTTSTAVLNITNSHFYNNTIETGIEHFDNTVGTIIQSGNTLENNPFTFSLGNDTTICNIDSITIGTGILGSNYEWNTGATTSTITVSDTGMYILNISMGACEYIDTIVISEMICGEICGNGIDDDGDGLIDCFDPECCGQLACDEHYYNECANSCEFSNNDSNVQAELKWQSNTEVSIASTPITGDIDGDGIPEIIIPTQSTASSNLSVINGMTGNLKFEIALPFNSDENGNLAIADVDNDGTAEIFNYRGATIYRYEHDGTLSASMAILGSAVGFSQRVGIADFDGDGVAEVYANNKIFNATDLSILANIPVTPADAQYAVAVDVLDDAACGNCEGLELVMGNKIYSINIQTGFVTMIMEAGLNMPNGIVSIADIDKDGDLDAVVSANLPSNSANSPHLIYAWDLQTNAIMGQFDPGDNASQSAIADFDGDGQLEIAFKTSSNLIVLENDFTQKWSTPSLEDDANFTAPVSFDFDGDGDFEIVARGTQELQIFDGTNGNVLFSAPAFSGTRAESPVIVDVDGDGLTEILISSANSQDNANNDIGFLKAYTSSSFPWQSTRKIWNQSNYFNVNIQDDLTIPMMQQQHHIVGNDVILNNFLTQHGERLGADASIASVDVLCALNDLIVTLEVCNTGQNELSYTTPITFYRDNPTTTATSALDTEVLGVTIPVDSCATVEFTIPAQYDDPVFIVVNDDNSTNTPFDLATDFPNTNIGECDYTNNMDVFEETPEPYELDLGGTIMICDNAAIELNATSHFVSYEWQDGTTDSVFTAYGGGEYWVTVIDSCGGTQSDTVNLTVIPNTVNMTMPTNAIVCPTQDTSFTVMGDFDTYKWIPNDFLDCDTCQTVQVIDPDEEKQYIVTASNSLTGCYSVDTVLLSFTSITFSDAFQICAGESIDIHGSMVSTPGTYSETFTSAEGCDSTSTITLTNFDELTLSFQTTPTCPQGNQGAISVFVSNGVATNYSWSISGAGNNPTVNNLPAGIYTVTIIDGNNCENIGSTEIIEDNNLPITTDFIAPTCPGGTDGSLEILNPMQTWTFSMDGTTFQDGPIFTELPAGTYDIFIQDGDCLYSGMTGTISDPAGINISGNVINGATFQDSTLINVVVNGDNPITNIQWSSATGVGGLSCTDCLTPMFLATQETETYTITVTDSEGCMASADFTVTTTFPCNPDGIEVPNVFTPDGDGVNDSFTAVIKEGLEEVAEMRIYNRWGNVVFESTNGLQPWDGKDGEKLAPMGVYVYVITIQCSIGEEKRVVKSGDVTLVR